MTNPDRPTELPWAQIPHWVMLSDVSREAKVIYVLLVMHVDRSEAANRRAWPSMKRLAKMAGFAKNTGIDKRVKELEKIGAVTVERGRNPSHPLRKRNTYYVKLAADPAPASYRGALSAWAFEDDEDDDLAVPATGYSDNDPWAVKVPEYPEAGTREHPLAGTGVYPPEGTEVDLVHKDLVEEDQPFASLLFRRALPPRPLCGRHMCKDGWIAVGTKGLNRVRCDVCPLPETGEAA